MMLKFYLCLAFVQVVFGANRYVIDSVSCKDDAVNAAVRLYMDNAISKAGLVAKILAPKAHFEPIGKYVYVDIDNRSDAWKQTRDKSDLEIHCNGDYITPLQDSPEPNINWRDEIQGLPVLDDDSILNIKDEKTILVAVTSPARTWKEGETWPDNIPEVITFNPWYIKHAVEKKSIFNSDRIKKALQPSLLKAIKIKFQRYTHAANVDTLDTPELTLIHELTHTALGGLSRDTGGSKSYGWYNCVRLKDVDNADNLAYFALVVDLIQNYKYEVDDKGNLQSFT
ncbi:hypothetical protein G7Z17_g11792 [Cylindrodendrum hubeiense]|uniref:Lysine-specific metallo-endopeptidase domain-containing protein n=1 Tax=Cylindrodendrum hubeiense TaxID=595255 RepID=A0A9P5GWU0_9HYPO|nr:hypothetical protein G7Z17_g11792 [Cylindrodendrum hubeiense]